MRMCRTKTRIKQRARVRSLRLAPVRVRRRKMPATSSIRSYSFSSSRRRHS